MRMIYLPLCLAALMLSGCDKDAQSSEAKEEKNPLVRTGQSYMEIKDWNKAEEAFKQAIESNPKMARPHLDLALIYHQYKPSDLNLIKSIYYYDRYLELRPDSEKADMINDQKMDAARKLVEKVVGSSPQVQQLAADRKRLLQENAELKRQLTALKKSAATQPVVKAPAPATTDSRTVAKTAPKPAASSGGTQHDIYTVRAGDTLTGIAKQFYGTSDYEPIYEANKDRMKSPSDLRVGQTLVIPKR